MVSEWIENLILDTDQSAMGKLYSLLAYAATVTWIAWKGASNKCYKYGVTDSFILSPWYLAQCVEEPYKYVIFPFLFQFLAHFMPYTNLM